MDDPETACKVVKIKLALTCDSTEQVYGVCINAEVKTIQSDATEKNTFGITRFVLIENLTFSTVARSQELKRVLKCFSSVTHCNKGSDVSESPRGAAFSQQSGSLRAGQVSGHVFQLGEGTLGETARPLLTPDAGPRPGLTQL